MERQEYQEKMLMNVCRKERPTVSTDEGCKSTTVWLALTLRSIQVEAKVRY